MFDDKYALKWLNFAESTLLSHTIGRIWNVKKNFLFKCLDTFFDYIAGETAILVKYPYRYVIDNMILSKNR